MNYPIETKHQFIQLRARDLSLSKISEQLNVPKSTLGAWNQDHEAEINQLKRLEWQEIEAEHNSSITHDLKRLMKRVRAAEDELDKRKIQHFTMFELFQLIRDNRREYARKRALLMADPLPKRNSAKQTQPAPSTPLVVPASAGQAPVESITPRMANNGPQAIPSPGGEGQDEGELPSARSALTQDSHPPTFPRAHLQSLPPAPLDESVRFTENRPIQPHNTNDLQQSPAEPSTPLVVPASAGQAPVESGTSHPPTFPPAHLQATPPTPKLSQLDPDDPSFYDESIVIGADDSARDILRQYGARVSKKRPQ